MSKTDDQIRSEIQSSEDIAAWGARGVIAGLVFEIVLAAGKSFEFLSSPHIENWGAVLADSLIALGVLIEIRFGGKASEGNAELRSRADERAAAAELRTEQLREALSWRRLSEREFRAIFETMRGYSMTVLISHVPNDPEATLYADDISNVLRASACTTVVIPDPATGRLAFGLCLFPRYGDSGAADRLALAFTNAGIDFAIGGKSERLAIHVGSRAPPQIAALAKPK